ncbi:DUF2117 domain-containing protein [Desulfobacula sp.]|uniref:DUF2117 domain-containing protein n=1 Tax=Desulfobacula sp. TaxID=2593537 RepID=UPI0026170565|nr:DUF2117 domain-containing protein [Desulfobacula sp.]
MIGILFHGAEVIDSGWAKKIIDAMETLDDVRCVLAGTMGRTAVIDSGLKKFEFWGKMPGESLGKLATEADNIILATSSKSEESATTFGGMVVKHADVVTPVVQVECSNPFYVEWVEGISPAIIDMLKIMGIKQQPGIEIKESVWESDGKIFRKMTTAKPNDFILVDGIMVGRAEKAKIIFVCKNGHIIDIQGCKIKQHGIEKLDRFGNLDIKKAKLASTFSIRGTETVPRIQPVKGSGVSFIDHAGMHVYDLAHNVEGVVTVGDDTTTVVADILYRSQIPVIGIIDGDRDTILKNPHYTPGSVLFTVPEDDEFGLKVFDTIFQNNQRLDAKFDEVLAQTEKLAKGILIEKRVLSMDGKRIGVPDKSQAFF